MSTLLTATDLIVRINERPLLDGATLAVEEDDRIGLVGRNGCGKTTFLRILAGLFTPDSGEVTRRRDLVVGYLAQEFRLDDDHTVLENIRAGAQHTLELIARFESLPADATEHDALERRIRTLDGWTLDNRIETAISHLHCPAADRIVGTLSGGEKRRVAVCRAIVARPDLLILDEPTNHLDPESIEWLATFLEAFHGAFLVVTHDRYFLDRVTRRMVELADGRFFSHAGNYTDYLLARAERQAADAAVEHKRQMFLKKELAWVRQGPREQRTKQKNRFERYYEAAAEERPVVEEAVELCIPPAPPMGNRILEATRLGVTLAGRTLFRQFNFSFEKGRRVGVVGRNGVGKTTLLRALIGDLTPTEGTVKAGELTRINYVDQGRLQLNDDRTVLDEIADGTEFVQWGDATLSLRAYLKRFLFADDRISTRVRYLSGGERSRLLLARILKQGGNFLILDEPTNDLDLTTLRVLEEALILFDGVVLVVSHDRYFLNRVCTDILAFEDDEQIVHSVGNYDDHVEWKRRNDAAAERASGEILALNKSSTLSGRRADVRPAKPRKLTWKEARELDGMEDRILDTESEIERIEALFASPEFHREHGTRTQQLKAELAAAKETLTELYARWEELEAIRTGSP